MGKVSPISTKYIIRAKFRAGSVIEKPDVIGAIFGQTEGLLGQDLELRDLQKKGKIGRIDVNLKIVNSKAEGIIEIPTSLDKTETTIIAAALETIERIGPADAKIQVEDIEDVRNIKREYIVERAKKLLEETGGIESKDIEKAVLSSLKTSRIIEYGPEKLPAGPQIEESNELIVVEGRADVINLIKYGINNVIAMNGSRIPKTIKNLGKKKELILFIDGDRGGFLNAKIASRDSNVKFIARAPDGKEVEELTEKEIIKCLRKKIPTKEFFKKYKTKGIGKREEIKKHDTRSKKRLTAKDKKILQNILQEIVGTRAAVILDQNLKEIKRVPVSELVRILHDFKRRKIKVFAIIMDGTAISTIIRAAEKVNCQYLIAKNFAAVKSPIVKLLSL